MNPFKIDVDSGYRWYTFGAGQEEDSGFVKLGPISIAWCEWFDGSTLVELTAFNRWYVKLWGHYG